MPLEHIGRYKIEAELGKGAMGVVYKATDPNIGRTVALKTLRVDVHGMESDEMVKRFHAEARNAGVLNHTNIVTIYDAQELEGIFYIAMEFIQGQTLQELLKIGNIPVEKMIDVTRQVCAGLDYASARGIVHRDVKPANIMIQPDGTVKIMDFGIAKGAGTGMTSTGQVLGTPNYMSPEQVKGKTLDGRSDLFSLGVVLYEMLTGERPFTGENVTTIIYKIVNEQPPAPCDLDVTVHPGLSAVVMKALSKNREERYQKGADLAKDLENYKNFGSDAAPATRVPSDQQAVALASPPAVKVPAAAPPVGPGAAAAVAVAKSTPKLDSTVHVGKKALKPTSPEAGKKAPMGLIVGVALVAVLAVAGYFVLKPKPSAPEPSTKVEQPSQPAASAAGEETPAKATSKSVAPGKSSAKRPEGEAVATGDLRITTTPAGATINVDGKDQPQQTPATIQLTPGQHAVVVSMDGYKPETRHPDITVGQRTNMTAFLTATAGFLVISSNPPGGEIVVDGRSTGEVTPSKIKVSQGQHTFTVRKPGAKEQTMSAFVLAGQTLPMDFTLPGGTQAASAKKNPETQNVPPSNASARAPAQTADPKESGNPFRKLGKLFGSKEDGGRLEIRSHPKGAEVFVNGNPTGKKTPIKTDSPVGKYTITLRMDGYKPVTRAITINKGQTTGIEETLVKQ